MQKMMTVPTQSLDAITFDGADLWISDTLERKIKKVSIAEQRILREIKFAPGGVPKAMTFANDSLLVLNYDQVNKVSSDLIQINLMNGKTLRTLHCPSEVDSGIAFDNTSFWGGSYSARSIVKFHPGTSEVIARYEMDAPVRSLAWSGAYLFFILDRFDGEEKSGLVVFDTFKNKAIKEVEIRSVIGGIAFAEEMIFFTCQKTREIQVTRIKID